MSYIYNDNLYTSTQQGSLSSANNELILTNGGNYTTKYNVQALSYNQADVTVGGPVKAIVPFTFTVYKYNNGTSLGTSSTITVSVSSTTPIPAALLLNTGGVTRPVLAVPFNITAGTTYVDTDLSAASVDFSDREIRRLTLLGYIG